MSLLQGERDPSWVISGDKLKISLKNLGMDWYEGMKQGLQKLIDGKNEKQVEETIQGKGKQVYIPTLNSL